MIYKGLQITDGEIGYTLNAPGKDGLFTKVIAKAQTAEDLKLSTASTQERSCEMTELIELRNILDKVLKSLAAGQDEELPEDLRLVYVRTAYDILEAKRKLTQTQIDLMDGDMTALMREQHAEKRLPMSEYSGGMCL